LTQAYKLDIIFYFILFSSFSQGDLEEDPEDDPDKEGGNNDNNEDPDLPESTPSPVAPTKAKMATVNFDSALEHFVLHFLKVKITNQIAYALDQAFINTFDEFRTIDTVDVHTFTYKLPGDSDSTLLHLMLVKQIQRGVHYCQFLEDGNDPACHNPTMMEYDKFNKWKRNSHAVYQASLNPPGTVIAPPSTYISATQKNDDAALISWNRKPRDVAKYPILKTDAGYPDWRLKMKRQLIADTLQRVMDPTFKIATSCRLGSDKELGELQINFFEHILSAVLLNPEGKGLVTAHPEDALYVWKQHEAHQKMSDSAQISTTALMNS
jgi:hypothetical protein